MKFRMIYTLFVAALGITLFLGNSNGRADGANWGNTGAPGDETLSSGASRTCQTCHGTGQTQVSLDIEVRDGSGELVTAYVPNETYNVSVIINHADGPMPAGYGFQMVSLINSDDSDVNAWSNPSTNTKIATASNTGRSYAEHNGVSVTNTFEVEWTAPAVGSGDVTFYSSGNGVNENGTTGGDGADTNSLTLAEDTDTGINGVYSAANLIVAPNPTQGFTNINLKDVANTSFTLDLLSVNGQLLSSRKIQVDHNNFQYQLPLNDLSNGIYFIRLANENGVLTERILKQ